MPFIYCRLTQVVEEGGKDGKVHAGLEISEVFS